MVPEVVGGLEAGKIDVLLVAGRCTIRESSIPSPQILWERSLPSINVPSAPLFQRIQPNEISKIDTTYEGQRAYGRDEGPCNAGIGRGGEFVQETHPEKHR